MGRWAGGSSRSLSVGIDPLCRYGAFSHTPSSGGATYPDDAFLKLENVQSCPSPNALKAAYGWAGATDLYRLYFDGGIYREEAMEPWLSGMLGGTGARDAYLSAPGKIVDNPERTAFWDAVDLSTRAAFVRVPMMHVVGWFDLFKQQGIEAFQVLNVLGATASASHAGAFGNQRILIGPWSHTNWFHSDQGDVQFPTNAGPGPAGGPLHPAHMDTLAYKSEIRFFDHWLRLEPRGLTDGYETELPVRYYVMGNTDAGGLGNFWRETTTWPPPDFVIDQRRWVMLGRGDSLLELRSDPLSTPKRAGVDGERSYTYDPTDPVPTVGGAILYATAGSPAGPRDQSAVEARPDVLAFTSPRLTEPMEVAGTVEVHLAVSSDATDTDFVVKLTDVYPDGRSILIAEGAIQARYRNGFAQSQILSGSPQDVVPVELSLGDVSMVLDVGHRFRVSVTSSNYPRLKPNPNTGASFFTDDVTALNSQVARTTLWCRPWEAGRSSWVTLPVIRR